MLRFSKIVVMCGLLSVPAMAQEPVEVVEQGTSQRIRLISGTSLQIRTPRPFSTVSIVDPAIADAIPETDRTFSLMGKTPGLTSLIVYDTNNVRISSVLVTVEKPAVAGKEFARDSFTGVVGRVKIYNHQRQLSGATVYACAPNGCELVKEVQSELPIFTQRGNPSPYGPQPQYNAPGPPPPPGVVGF